MECEKMHRGRGYETHVNPCELYHAGNQAFFSRDSMNQDLGEMSYWLME